MQTKLTKLLGIRHPIIQGGMAWIADASLASAVSNAGGLGIISAMNANADWVREEIRKCREATDQPFGVNIMLMSPHVEEVAQMVAEEKVPVVTTGAGNPSRFVKLWKEAGVKILPVVASTALAKMVERAGVDAVIAEGGESGGHVGDLTTLACRWAPAFWLPTNARSARNIKRRCSPPRIFPPWSRASGWVIPSAPSKIPT